MKKLNYSHAVAFMLVVLQNFQVGTAGSGFLSEEKPNWVPLLLFVIISSGMAASIGVFMMCKKIELDDIPELDPMPEDNIEAVDSGKHSRSFYKSYPLDYDSDDFHEESHTDPHQVVDRQTPLPTVNVNTHCL